MKQRNIIEPPGGVPLYMNGKLRGATGVSGDGVDQDGNVAEAGVVRFEPSPRISTDCVLNTGGAYTNGVSLAECWNCQQAPSMS